MAAIAFFEVKPWERAYLKKRLKGHELLFSEHPLEAGDIEKIRESDVLSVFIYSRVDAATIAALPQLRLVATRSTGFDHIDLAACRTRGITVCTVPFYGENTVAEHTFALILALSRNVHKSYLRMQHNDYSIEGLTGFDLKGKTIGVVGGGHIGLHVVRIAKGFGMNVLVYDVQRQNFLAEVLGFSYATLDELLEASDIISLHVPHNEATHHLINRENLNKVKRGAVLINTARGGVVDTDALLWALEEGILGGAGLDVIEGEELVLEEKQLLESTTNPEKWRTVITSHRTLARDNVVFTPHNSFNSREALHRILDTTVENITAGLEGNCRNRAEA